MMKGVKQAEIADLLEVRQQSVSKLENGKTRISKMVADKIARYLGFSNGAEMEHFYEKHISSHINIDGLEEPNWVKRKKSTDLTTRAPSP